MSTAAGFTIYRREIPEVVVEGRRLGRHVHHDSRSLAYRIEPVKTIASQRWTRDVPILDQGNLGSCTGNAATGALGTAPLYDALSDKLAAGLKLDESEALALYSSATQLDSYAGSYPPDDTGSDGLSVAKAAQQAGLISGYTHALSLDDLLSGLQTGPMIVGTNWYDGMDSPDANGVVQATGSIRGGHEYECIGVDVDTKLLHFANSWGTGWGQQGYFSYSYDTMTKLLSEDGDATKLIPLSAPAPTPTPTPTPTPGAAPFPGARDDVAAHIASSAARDGWTVTHYQNRHWARYFGLPSTSGDGDE